MKTDDFLKIYRVLFKAAEYHEHRDRMNSAVHLAEEVIFSPLTSELMAASRRADDILTAHGQAGGGPEI